MKSKKIYLVAICYFIILTQGISQKKVADFFEDKEVKRYYLNKKSCTEIELGSNNLTELPSDIIEYENVRYINLSNNPELDCNKVFLTLQSLKHLRALDLVNNRIDTLPESLMLLKNLKYINLSHNNISNFPYWLKDMNQLNVMDLGNINNNNLNQIFECLPESLTSLDLSDNDIDTIPSNISRLINLESISLGQNNLETLPCDFLYLKKLEFIYLGKNNIQFYPMCLYDFKALKVIPRAYFK